MPKPLRDKNGNFVKKTKLNALRHSARNRRYALPVIALVVLVGAIAIFRSFAAEAVGGAYQFSAARCTTKDAKTTCPSALTSDGKRASMTVNQTAEAAVYRLYEGIAGKRPDDGGYKFWVQRLAGDRERPSDLANSLVSTPASKKLSNEAFTTTIYQQFFGKPIDAEGKAYWVKQLDSKNWTRTRMAATFLGNSQAVKNHSAGFATFLKSAPKVTVKENAKADQQKRAKQAATYASANAGANNQAAKYVKLSAPNLSTAKKLAAKKAPSEADLQAIAANDKTVKDYTAKAQTAKQAATTNLTKLQAIAQNAHDVTVYSPDIPDTSVKQKLKAATKSRDAIGRTISKLQNITQAIGINYQKAEKNYEADLIAKQKAAEAAEAKQQDDGGGDAAVATGKEEDCRAATCVVPANAIPTGATTAQKDLFYKSFCNSQPDVPSTRSRIPGAFATAEQYRKVYYKEDGKHRRSCSTALIEKWNGNTYRCDGERKLGITSVIGTGKNARNLYYSSGSCGCPDGFFSNKGKCTKLADPKTCKAWQAVHFGHCYDKFVSPLSIKCKGGDSNRVAKDNWGVDYDGGVRHNIIAYYCKDGTVTGSRRSVTCPNSYYPSSKQWSYDGKKRTIWDCNLIY